MIQYVENFNLQVPHYHNCRGSLKTQPRSLTTNYQFVCYFIISNVWNELLFSKLFLSITEKASQNVTENIIFTWHKTEINRIANMEFITTTRGGQHLTAVISTTKTNHWTMEARTGNVKKGEVGRDARLKLSCMSRKTSVISLVSTGTHQTLRQYLL